MENTKAKNVIIVVLILISVCMAGFLGYYIGEYKRISKANDLKQDNTLVDTTNQDQTAVNENQNAEEESKTETTKQEAKTTYTVKDLVKAESKTLTKNGYKLKYTMPQIISNKSGAKKINTEIKEMISLAKEVFNNKTSNRTITYKVEIKENILKITIKDEYTPWDNTGLGEVGDDIISTTIIEYDYVNDKRIK